MALAGVLSQQQKYGEADAQCREVIALEENVLGTDHPTTISSWYAFAYQLARENKTEEAMQFARKAASAAEQSLGQDHPDTRKYAQLVQQLDSHARTVPEYTAAEATKHIGEKATVAGKVECITAGRTYHALDLDGCTPTSPFWIIVNNDVSGTDLNVQGLKGVTIAVTGKIESQDGYPWIVVKSTTQIQPRSALHTDHISLVAGQASAQGPDKQVQAARQEYEQSSRDEAARLRYMNKLAGRSRNKGIAGEWPARRDSPEYDKLAREINDELRNHPTPKDIDSKKLSKLLVGEWQSPHKTHISFERMESGEWRAKVTESSRQ